MQERVTPEPVDRSVRERILDAAVRLLAAADPVDLLAFIGPKRAAAAAAASVGGLYHHWPEGAPAFAADVAAHARRDSAAELARGMGDAVGFDDLAGRLVAAVRAGPGAAGLSLVAPDAGTLAPAVTRLLERAGRTPRPPWTVDRVATLVVGAAIGITAVEAHPEPLVVDAVRLIVLSTCAVDGDLRSFETALAGLDSTPVATREGWSIVDRIPSVRLGFEGRQNPGPPVEPLAAGPGAGPDQDSQVT